jgi:hypothetical protein
VVWRPVLGVAPVVRVGVLPVVRVGVFPVVRVGVLPVVRVGVLPVVRVGMFPVVRVGAFPGCVLVAATEEGAAVDDLAATTAADVGVAVGATTDAPLLPGTVTGFVRGGRTVVPGAALRPSPDGDPAAWSRGCAGSFDGNRTGRDRPGSGTPPSTLTTKMVSAARPSSTKAR